MESAGSIPCFPSQVQETTKKEAKRSWTTEEEKEFINALKAACAAGLKSDNGFWAGHLPFLLKHMQDKFPGTDLCIKPHIESKIKVWKTTYAFLVTILTKSGVGWDTENKTVDCSKEIWKQYSQGIKGMGNKKNQTWIYYDDWVEIFGKDRANGSGSKDFVDAANISVPNASDPKEKDKGKEKESLNEEILDEDISFVREEMRSSARSKKRSKSKPVKEVDANFAEIMKTIVDLTKESLETFKKPKHADDDVSEYTILNDALKYVTSTQRVTLGRKLANNERMMKYFVSLPQEDREEFLAQMLEEM